MEYLKTGWNRKEGTRNKNFKKIGQAESRVGCLKQGRLEPFYKLRAPFFGKVLKEDFFSSE